MDRTEDSSADSAKTIRRDTRRAARLAAVQALYEIDLIGATPKDVLAEFDRRGSGGMLEDGALMAADRPMFARIVKGVFGRSKELDALLDQVLTEGWTVARLEVLLRAILRAGAFELLARPEVPVRVVVSEHVDIAHAFLSDKETGLVNGVLDRLARRLRPREMGETEADEEGWGDGPPRPIG
ncbi:MAG: transcription antitermination factor NusB [Rhodospirillaceae bacterium]|jgi:transcription antitermination protein NusB|nr:transcription antitermination factor NusB [Rhodospirillaceae bacterium]MBT6118024.1 transcription antitermination factor NusB [Rhodospirillaceae bacterium]